MCLNAWPKGNGTIRKHGLTEGVGFEVSNAQATPSGAQGLLLLPADLDVELLVPSSAPCLPAI